MDVAWPQLGGKRPKDFGKAWDTLFELKKLTGELMELKNKKGALAQATALERQAKLLMVRLKRSNQTAHLDLDAEQKLQEEEARSISHLRRELHNLVYERSCIQEEIEGCQAHRAKHEDLDILPASAIAPALLEEAKGDEEKVLKLRLQAECAERQKMCERIKELRARKEQLLKSGKEKASFFDGIQSHVVQLRDIVEPIRKQLSAEQMELHENTELAQKLPSALYVIYYQAVVYAAAHPAQMRVEINGDREQADHYLQQQSRGGDEDGELVDTFDRHPLSVSCTVLPPQERLSPITAKFHYLTRLQVVTVTEKDTEKSPFRPFLGSLYPNDSGNSSPNPATASLLPSGFAFSSTRKEGKPYKFAQQLAGLRVLTEELPNAALPFEVPSQSLGPPQAMELFVTSIRFRTEAFEALHEQIKTLRGGAVPQVGNYKEARGVTLKSCTKISRRDYVEEMERVHQGDIHLDSLAFEDQEHSSYLLLTVEPTGNSANKSIRVVVHISMSYPFVPPLFTLLPSSSTAKSDLPEFVRNSVPIGNKSPRLARSNDPVLDEVERQVNVQGQLVGSEQMSLLAVQVTRLMSLLAEYFARG